jgi:hypothetical protein
LAEPLLRNTGVIPADDRTGDFTFFANYYSAWYYQPLYVCLWIDGVNHTMVKNDTGDTDPRYSGINYTYSEKVGIGLHNYSFHTRLSAFPAEDRTTGDYWLLINIHSARTGASFGLIILFVAVATFVLIVLWVKMK